MLTLNILFTFLLGLVLGSFISALTYRIPRNFDFIKGRSFCDTCKKNLFWYDNIPLFSFLLYRGKSRCCNTKISIRYPLIELSSAIGATTLFAFFPFATFITYYLLFLLTLSIFIIDLEHQIIPDEISWSIFILGILLSGQHLFGVLLLGFFLSFSILLVHLVTKGQGMGLGDVKLAIALGVWFSGITQGITWLTVSFIIGGIVAIMLLLLKKANMKTKIAFGPFLIIGFWITLIFFK